VGRHYEYTHSDRLYDILRAAPAPVEDHHALEYGLATRAVACVILNLSADQYAKLKRVNRPTFTSSPRGIILPEEWWVRCWLAKSCLSGMLPLVSLLL